MTYETTEWEPGDIYRYQHDDNYFSVGVVMSVNTYRDGKAVYVNGREFRVFMWSDGTARADTIDLDATHEANKQLIKLSEGRPHESILHRAGDSGVETPA